MTPIILFVYNRPNQTLNTIESLLRTEEAKQTELIIIQDGFKTSITDEYNDVKNICQNVKGFQKVTYIQRSKNMGLKANIINGLNEQFQIFDKLIILEDDIQVHPHFLFFMNRYLNFFEFDNSVWHINGWNFELNEHVPNLKPKIYFSNIMHCWGWATWKNRWERFLDDDNRILSKLTLQMKLKLNLNGYAPYYSHLLGNFLGIKQTWAIYWFTTIAMSEGKCVSFYPSLTHNSGSDSSGTNEIMFSSLSNPKIDFNGAADKLTFTTEIDLSSKYIRATKRYLHKELGFKSRLNELIKTLLPNLLIKLIIRWKK